MNDSYVGYKVKHSVFPVKKIEWVKKWHLVSLKKIYYGVHTSLKIYAIFLNPPV